MYIPLTSTPVFMSLNVGGPRSQCGCLGEEKYLTSAGNRNLAPHICSLVSVPTTLLAAHTKKCHVLSHCQLVST